MPQSGYEVKWTCAFFLSLPVTFHQQIWSDIWLNDDNDHYIFHQFCISVKINNLSNKFYDILAKPHFEVSHCLCPRH